MKKFLLFLLGMSFGLQCANAQIPPDPFARHFWLNNLGENFTLSTPTSDGRWIIAAPRNNLLAPGGTVYAARKNTIAVFKVENADYSIVNSSPSACSDEVAVIGVKIPGTEKFDENVDFVVHGVVQSCNPDTNYIICGSISMFPNDTGVGMVAILNSQLELVSLRQYPEVRIFYDVYAQDGFYFVCGQMNIYNRTPIVLRDSIASLISAPNITAFSAINYAYWNFHKIAVRKDPKYPSCAFEFSVSGAEDINSMFAPQIGWATFQISLGNLTFANAAYSWRITHNINSRVTITNYPYSSTLGTPQGILLAASSGTEIYTYAFNNNTQQIMNGGYRMPWQGILTDIECGEMEDATLGYKVAYVGNRGAAAAPASYIRTEVPYPYPSTTLPSLAQHYYFAPFNAPSNAYYSLYKVHYYAGDKQFHAGGFYNGTDETGRQNRSTFAVTPEKVTADNQCTQRNTIKPANINTVQIDPIPMARVYIEGVKINDILTHRYRFCTMNCAGKRNEDCGNILIR